MNDRIVHFWIPNVFEFKGGIQVYLRDFLQVIDGENSESVFSNINFKVFSKLDCQKPKDLFNSEKLDFIFFGSLSRYIRTIVFSFALIIRAFLDRPALILCGHLNFSPVAYIIHRCLGIPYWILVYGVDAWDVKDPLKVAALKDADKVVSISDYTRRRLVQEQDLDPNDIPLLPVTFDVNSFQITQKPDYLLRRHKLHPDQPVILTVSRLAKGNRYKGYDNVIRALPEVQRLIPDVRYFVIGKGDDRPRVESLIKELGLEESVVLTGFIPDEEIIDYYNLCDVFAMPSKGEGFGIVYLEAMACGKPCLGGNQDGALDALCHGELGALVNPNDIDEIADTLVQILQKTYPNSLMYQPDALRQKVIEIYGFQRFQQTLAKYLNESLK